MSETSSTVVASASIANAIPVEPPLAWFEDPKLNQVTPITVSNDGRIYGHLASWDSVHIGMAGSIHPPRNSSNYAFFNKGVLRTAEGVDVRVGQFTLVGGHAPIHLSASDAVRHYDDTHSAYADVHVGEDSYGIWFAGALRPGVTPEQVRSIRASALSGDWRAINRRLELIATCSVNVPGFQMQRSMVASGMQNEYALVAAGIVYVGEEEEIEEVFSVETVAAAAQSRLDNLLGIDEYITSFKNFSPEKREELAKDGKALPDGSFPIENVGDLRRAVRAYGRADEKKRAKVRRHIVKRARALDKTDLVPSDWKELAVSDHTLSLRDQYDGLMAEYRAAQVHSLSQRVNTPASLAARVESLKARVNQK